MQPTVHRPDEDIEEDIDQLVKSFAPLKASRGYFQVKSLKGNVKLMGNVRSPQAHRVLMDNVPRVRGVVNCDGAELYDDEMIRFATGQLLPPGVNSSVHYGAVALTGELPSGASAQMIMQAIGDVKGVRRVAADFGTGVAEIDKAAE